MADAADARRRAEEALAFMDAALRDEMPPLPTQVKALADAVRALLAAGPGAEAPPSDAVREAAERLRQLLRPPVTMTPDGYAFFRVEDVETVLRALAAPPSTVTVPDDAAVREAAERLVHKIDEVNASTAYIGIWDFAAQHSLRYDGPRFVGELDALRAALSRPAAKGGDE